MGLRRGFIPGVPVPRFAIPDRHGPVFSERFSPNATGLQPPYRFSPGEAVAAERGALQGADRENQPPDATPEGRRLCGGRMRDGGQDRYRFPEEMEGTRLSNKPRPRATPPRRRALPCLASTQARSLAWPAPARIDTLNSGWPLPKLMWNGCTVWCTERSAVGDPVCSSRHTP